ncbi:NADH-quinone oxidoreductase subunit C [Ferrimicrobium sp.]|uniref:hydrogenase large subunit n=1 Tax=Ferrimicrobium sp. TaxID=2926050 RepID=UPI00262CA5D6|nr:NADH-quinone oxidoreductase subunit C [Ferrimicrobium sp.]
MSSKVPTRSLKSQELAPALSAALRSGGRVALVGAEDRQEDGIIEIAYVLVNTPTAPLMEWTVPLERSDPQLPSMASLDFSIGRFEREIADQFGVTLIGHPQPARLVKHAHWPENYHPLLNDAAPSPGSLADETDYKFLEVDSDAIYEIGVGPVHAGIIEPGHFRFSAVGESIITMKARLWFVHRGIEKLFEGRSYPEAIVLAEKISGDTSIGHSLAMAEAVEDALGIEIDPTSTLVRQLLLGMEQVYNLVNDIGAIANDVAFSIIHAFTGVQREYIMRENKRLTGHRLLRGSLRLGGGELREQPNPDFFLDRLAAMNEIIDIFTSNVMAMDRLKGTGILDTVDAKAIGCVGYVAQASGVPVAQIEAPSRFTAVDHDTPADTHSNGGQNSGKESSYAGDVAARLDVRIEQLRATLLRLAELSKRLGTMPASNVGCDQSYSSLRTNGVGCVESWRGRLTHRVITENGRILRAKIVDPSFFNWPAVSVSLRGAMVADFPLINKSFNLSYAGNDL